MVALCNNHWRPSPYPRSSRVSTIAIASSLWSLAGDGDSKDKICLSRHVHLHQYRSIEPSTSRTPERRLRSPRDTSNLVPLTRFRRVSRPPCQWTSGLHSRPSALCSLQQQDFDDRHEPQKAQQYCPLMILSYTVPIFPPSEDANRHHTFLTSVFLGLESLSST